MHGVGLDKPLPGCCFPLRFVDSNLRIISHNYSTTVTRCAESTQLLAHHQLADYTDFICCKIFRKKGGGGWKSGGIKKITMYLKLYSEAGGGVSKNRRNIRKTLLCIWLLLFLGGDIETNPGPTRDFTVLQWNENGILESSHFADLHATIEDLGPQRPHCIIIGESKLDQSYPDNLAKIDGYSILRCDRDPSVSRKSKGGGGVLVYVDNDIHVSK